MTKTYVADRPCPACGYWPNLKRAKFDGSVVEYDTDEPNTVRITHKQCGSTQVLWAPAKEADTLAAASDGGGSPSPS